MTIPEPTLRWIPLVQRPRPPGRPLRLRIEELWDLSSGSSSTAVQLAEAFNKAALIASDTGLPDLAKELCWRQHEVFQQAHKLTDTVLELAIQPPLNIPRQLIREGRTKDAFTTLESLYNAAIHRTDVTIDGHTVDFRPLTPNAESHKTICTLVWATLLADGARALIAEGRWSDAAEKLAAHRGIGKRLLDGRQVAIIAQLQENQTKRAIQLLDETSPGERWEHLVASILRAICHTADGHVPTPAQRLCLTETTSFVSDSEPLHTAFAVRVGLTALSINDDLGCKEVQALLRIVLSTARADGYAARDILAHPVVDSMANSVERGRLVSALTAAGLGSAGVPISLLENLMEAVELAERRLRDLLGAQP